MKSLIQIPILLTLVVSVYGQDEFEVIQDFETAFGEMSGWDLLGFTGAGEPVHGGNSAGVIAISNPDGNVTGRYTFPEPFDASEADEFRIWVYSESVFHVRIDLGVQVPMGRRYYGPDDVGTWKELVFWINEEESILWQDLLSSVSELRLFLSNNDDTFDGVDYPQGFEDILYIDDIRIRKRVPVEREFVTLFGFNEPSEDERISLDWGGVFFDVDLTGDPVPTEGTGMLSFDFVSAWVENIIIDLHDHPEILDYDRIHFDMFIEPVWLDWAATLLILKATWTEPDGSMGELGWTPISEIILGSIVGEEWGEISGQYGPIDSEGFLIDAGGRGLTDVRTDLEKAFSDPNGTVTLTLTSNGGGGVDNAPTYVDNFRMSRPASTAILDWEIR